MFDSSHQSALAAMLRLQDKMNRKVHADWPQQNYEWYRAVWIECAELMDHQGYKWWKKQDADVEQLQMEIIDIWHFGMSAMLAQNDNADALAATIVEQLNNWSPAANTDVLIATEALASHCLQTKGFSVPLFWNLLQAGGLDFGSLYKQYVGKNVLNFFRQDHGYKTGSYVKVWGGEEDNVHLVEILANIDASSTTVADDIYAQLSQRYQSR